MKLTLPGRQANSLQDHHLLDGDSVNPLQWHSADSYIVVGRANCAFFRLELADVPEQAQRGFISQTVDARSPWSQPAYYVAMDDDGTAASVWVWSADWEDALRKQLTGTRRNAPALPESTLLQRANDGLKLLRCHRGYDLQCWESGSLTGSRWFADLPGEDQLALFAMSHRRPAAEPPDPAQADWLSMPWTEQRLSLAELIRDRVVLAMGCAALLLLYLCLELTWAGTLALRSAAAESSAAQLQAELGDRLQQRLMAERVAIVNEQWSQLLPRYTHLELVAEFTSRMESEDFQLQEWLYDDGVLRVTILSDALDTRAAVANLEASALFEAVRLQPGLRDGEFDLIITIKVSSEAA